MAGDRHAQARARANGWQGEHDALTEGLGVLVGSSNLTDGPGVDVKVADLVVAQPGGRSRTGRYRFEKHQHDHLVSTGGTYHFRVKLGDKTAYLCSRPASEIPINGTATLSWMRACARPKQEKA